MTPEQITRANIFNWIIFTTGAVQVMCGAYLLAGLPGALVAMGGGLVVIAIVWWFL